MQHEIAHFRSCEVQVDAQSLIEKLCRLTEVAFVAENPRALFVLAVGKISAAPDHRVRQLHVADEISRVPEARRLAVIVC